MSLHSTQHIHTFNDGGKLRMISARDLIQIPIWQGNRILDIKHKEYLQTQIGNDISTLDRQLYHCATFSVYDEIERTTLLKRELLDGQHRSRILNEYFQKNPKAPDFEVLIYDYDCATEADVIARFKVLNTAKPMNWKDDPKISAGPYLAALETEFNRGRKQQLIKQGFTYRPYMTVDSLRDALVQRRVGIRTKDTPEEFAKRAKGINDQRIRALQEKGANDKQIERAIQLGFVLAMDKQFSWLDELVGPALTDRLCDTNDDLTWDDI